ncbi:MAG: hypothetical protein NT157_01935 [Candidatus Micrarchaeota archaeon]|nr:hypothetical protein [Candidatus Micrarchaeota archaeon]
MRFAVWLVALLMLLLLSPAAGATWTKEVKVYVSDAGNRPIANAKVDLTWQFTEIKDGEATVYANDVGIASANLTNLVYESRASHDVTIVATYGLQTVTKKANLEFSPDIISAQLALYQIKATVLDQDNAPVQGVSVYTPPWTFKTDSAGYAIFRLPKKGATIVAEYGDVRSEKSISVTGDASVEFKFTLPTVTIKVLDERGNPIVAVVRMRELEKGTDREGNAVFAKVPYYSANVTVSYAGNEKTERIFDIRADMMKRIIFDFSPPFIANLNAQLLDDKKIRVYADVVEQGIYASGLDPAYGVKLFASTGGEFAEYEMFPLNSSAFQATIPKQPDNTTITYYVAAADRQGNEVQSSSNTYTTPAPEPPPGPGPSLIPSVQFEWWWLIVIVVVIVVAVVAYIIFKED